MAIGIAGGICTGEWKSVEGSSRKFLEAPERYFIFLGLELGSEAELFGLIFLKIKPILFPRYCRAKLTLHIYPYSRIDPKNSGVVMESIANLPIGPSSSFFLIGRFRSVEK